MTSELQHQPWALLSNRGCEATDSLTKKRGVWSIDSEGEDVASCIVTTTLRGMFAAPEH